MPMTCIDRLDPETKDESYRFHPWCMRRGRVLCAFLASQAELNPYIRQFSGSRKVSRHTSQSSNKQQIVYYQSRNAATLLN